MPVRGRRDRPRADLDVAADASAVTGQGGRFEISGLEAGRYQLDTETLRGSLLDRREIHLGGDRDLRIDLVTGALDGSVVDRDDGSALSDVQIYLEPSVGEPALTTSLSTHSDSQGRFGFDRLAEGAYRLRAELAGYGFERREVTVRAGLRRFTLRSGRATIEGLGPGAWSVVVTASGERWTGQVTAPLGGGDVELVLE